MKRILGFSIAAAVVGLSAAPAFAQGNPQTLGIVKVDPQTLATGFRATKMVGSKVVNEANENIGTIDDLIITTTEKVPFAVLSVGGFLGMGNRHVVVPFSSLRTSADRIMLPGATKDSLKLLPEYKYN